MDQNSYELIMACIQHGAPAVSNNLILSLNTVIEKANKLLELQRINEKAAKATKAEEVKEAKITATEVISKKV